MKKFNRINVIVLDSVGIGQMPDCEKYGDSGVNTLGNISHEVGLEMPNMAKLGLGNINYIKTVLPSELPSSNFTKMNEVADGKDTLTGHWEMMGCTLKKGFKQFVDNGFPEELIKEFEKRTGRGVIANKEANGMNVIKEYFKEHVETGKYIIYTSVDSTFQIAAHEDVISLEELYDACKIARELTIDPKYNIARVIARPFIGDFENFSRTANRHDYAMDPFNDTVMDYLLDAGLDSIAIGKINDIFNGKGISKAYGIKSNMDGVDKNIEILNSDNVKGLIFTNLVEFDSSYGHPRDVSGYRDCLEEFDKRIPEILSALKEDDLLIITADHGNDPTFKGNNHTREYVPLIVYSKSLIGNNELKKRSTFADLGQTIAENFEVRAINTGNSFLKELK